MNDTKSGTIPESSSSDVTTTIDEAIPTEQNNEIETKLDEADILAEADSKRLTHSEVFGKYPM